MISPSTLVLSVSLTAFATFESVKKDTIKVIRVMWWSDARINTTKNKSLMNPVLGCCALLRKFSTLLCWWNMKDMFGKYGAQFSEIFWKTLENFLNLQCSFLFHSLRIEWCRSSFANFVSAVHTKTGALDNCIGFIDWNVIFIAHPYNCM